MSQMKKIAANVFYCKEGHEPVAVVAGGNAASCVLCKNEYETIGWMESAGGMQDRRMQDNKAQSPADVPGALPKVVRTDSGGKSA